MSSAVLTASAGDSPQQQAAMIACRLSPFEIPRKRWFISGAYGLRLLGYDPSPLGAEWTEACDIFSDDNTHPLSEAHLTASVDLPAPLEAMCLGELRDSNPRVRVFSAHRFALPLTFLKKVTLEDRTKVRYGQLKAQARIFSMRAGEIIDAQETSSDTAALAGHWIEHLRRWQKLSWQPGDQWMAEFLADMIDFYEPALDARPLRRSRQVRIGKSAGVF